MAEKKSVLPNITLLKEKITYFSIEETGLKKIKGLGHFTRMCKLLGRDTFRSEALTWSRLLSITPD